MNATQRSAFTLIEMLIVVAIMAILAAGMTAFITLPPREQAQATTDLEIEQGLGGFFAKLVADAHNATTLTLAQDGRALIFAHCREGASAVYFLDRKDCLRRSVTASTEWVKSAADPTSFTAALLARGVRRLAATPLKETGKETGLWRIDVSLSTGDDLRPTLDRSLELSVGHFRRK